MRFRHLACAALAALLSLSSGILLGQEQDTDEADKSQPDRISEPLDQVLAGKRTDPVALRISWKENGVFVTADFYGAGFGIWNRHSQFALPRPVLMSLLQSVKDAGFGGMPRQFGVEPEDLVELRGRVTLTIGDVSQSVEQLTTGEQSEPLADIVKKGFAEARPRGAHGVTIASLEEGLAALASGRLAPETLDLTIAVRRDAGSAAPGPEGWLLKIGGLRAEAFLYRRQGGYEPGHETELSKKEFRALVGALARSHPSRFSQNVSTDEYTDLRVSILDQTRDVAARRTARSGPPSVTDQEQALTRLRGELLDLAQAVLRRAPPRAADEEHGSPTGWPKD